MRVRVTDDAKADLREIKAFISGHSVSGAVSVIEQIRKTLTLLALLPRPGHARAVYGTFEKGVPRVPYLIAFPFAQCRSWKTRGRAAIKRPVD